LIAGGATAAIRSAEIVAVNLRGNAALGVNNADLQQMVRNLPVSAKTNPKSRQFVRLQRVAQEVPARK
jgi:hypothetical protein